MKIISFIGQNHDENFESNVLKYIRNYNITNNNALIKENNKVYSEYIVINSCENYDAVPLECNFCLANMDKLSNNEIYVKGNLITYGFGNKNTVTISSVEDENQGFVYCLQRYINSSSLIKIEPQEIPVKIKFKKEEELYSYMVAITISLIENTYNKTK